MIKAYCQEYHSKNIMNITVFLFPSIFVHLEKAQVENEISFAEEEKRSFIKTEEKDDNEEIQVEVDVSFLFLGWAILLCSFIKPLILSGSHLAVIRL
jgi:hypothetical protein